MFMGDQRSSSCCTLSNGKRNDNNDNHSRTVYSSTTVEHPGALRTQRKRSHPPICGCAPRSVQHACYVACGTSSTEVESMQLAPKKFNVHLTDWDLYVWSNSLGWQLTHDNPPPPMPGGFCCSFNGIHAFGDRLLILEVSVTSFLLGMISQSIINRLSAVVRIAKKYTRHYSIKLVWSQDRVQ